MGNVKVQEHPGELKVGYCPLVLIRTAKSACKMTKIYWKITKKNMKLVKKKSDIEEYKEADPKFIKNGDTCEIEFQPQIPMAASQFWNLTLWLCLERSLRLSMALTRANSCSIL